MDVRVGLWRKLRAKELLLLNCGVGEDSWESLGLQGDPTSPFWRRSALGVHWKDWCWSWNSNTLATWYEELTHLIRPWCWERLRARGEGDDRGWDGWMASSAQWTWVWVNSGSWWWTGRPGCCGSWGCKESDTTEPTELNWTCFLNPSAWRWIHILRGKVGRWFYTSQFTFLWYLELSSIGWLWVQSPCLISQPYKTI